MAEKYPSDTSYSDLMDNLHIDSANKDEPDNPHVIMETALNADIGATDVTNMDSRDINTIDQMLILCLKCTNYVMANRCDIAYVLTKHECLARSETSSAENLILCMHKIIDAIAVCDTNMTMNTAQLPMLRCHPAAAPSLLDSIIDLSSVASASNLIHMRSEGNIDETSFNLHQDHKFTTSTPKMTNQSKNDAR